MTLERLSRETLPYHPFCLRADDALFLFIDLQERFVPSIADITQVVARAHVLARGIRALDLPFLVTEQYPRGLGVTLPEIRAALGAVAPIEKTAFSCLRAEGVCEALARSGRQSVVVVGIEAHVCVLQTVLDLIVAGCGVWVCADAVGSRAPSDRLTALAQMDRAGAVVTSVEAVLFELLGDARAEHFREVQAIVK